MSLTRMNQNIDSGTLESKEEPTLNSDITITNVIKNGIVWRGTQTEYENIQLKNPKTMYIILEDQ